MLKIIFVNTGAEASYKWNEVTHPAKKAMDFQQDALRGINL